MNRKPASFIFYRGPSVIDGSPIVGIAIIPRRSRGNVKTGAAMVQTYILRDDLHPVTAVREGADVSICGACPHRGDGTGRKRTCYVQLQQGPSAVWKGLQSGRYVDRTSDHGRGQCADLLVRLGAYGDPAAIPAAAWSALLDGAADWTGYTHQWKAGGSLEANALQLRPYVMASAESCEDRADAKPAGWRTFRVVVGDEPAKLPGESVCPASKEAGAKLQCAQCMACNGLATGRRGDIAIRLHGGSSVKAAVPALIARLVA
jgi:hypothetical protein